MPARDFFINPFCRPLPRVLTRLNALLTGISDPARGSLHFRGRGGIGASKITGGEGGRRGDNNLYEIIIINPNIWKRGGGVACEIWRSRIEDETIFMRGGGIFEYIYISCF